MTTPAKTTDPLFATDAVAKYLGVGIPAIERWRQIGTGPDYIKVGRLVRYRQSALDAWVAKRTVATEQKSGLKSKTYPQRELK